jgi:uncharacterized iron-regulated membrane protein
VPHLRLLEGGRSDRSGRYRRRRLVAAVLAALVVVLAWSAASAVWSSIAGDPTVGVVAGAPTPVPAAVGPATASTAPAVHVVQPGETLWSIARGVQPTGDVRPLVDELADRVGGAGLQAGQRIDLGGLAD